MTFAFALALAMGLLVGASRLWPEAGSTIFFGVGVFLSLVVSAASLGEAAELGAVFALGYAGLMLVKLRLPLPVTALLIFSQLSAWTLLSLGAWKLVELPLPLGIVATACLGTFLFWLEWTLLPLWGTAQNFSCSSPVGASFISLFGAAGGSWVALCISGFYAQFLYMCPISVAMLPLLWWAIGFLVFFQVLANRLFQDHFATLRVATFGWAGPEFNGLTEIPAEYQHAAREASELGARLLVTPEAAIQVQDRTHFRVAIGTLAQKYNLALAIGYFDQKQNENCIDFVSAQGEVIARYVKTHLVPVLEDYKRGQGDIALMEVDGVKVGGVICQDDNFPDIARKYARVGIQLLVVPTHDWKNVKDIHFANHLWRGLEFRFALARAASGGISAMTSAAGRIQKSSDHFQSDRKLLVADVQVGSGKPTLYARTGDWFPIACGAIAICALIWAR